MLEEFFSPRSVAVIGVSRDEGKVGHIVFDNLRTGGFAGKVYPVNPGTDEIHGFRCYPSVTAIDGDVDLAVVVVPARFAESVVRECGEKGIRSVVVITAGFKETGREGAALERALVTTARSYGMRLLGPNCLGLISAHSGLNASFAVTMPRPGSISFMSQSGALGTAVLDWTAGEGIGLANFVSLGNKADLSEVDLVKAWAEEPHTKVVAAYLEAVSDGRAFVEAVAELVCEKPFVALKSGVSDAGARAVSSHTGSLAGSERAYDAAFLKAGAIRARTIEELFDISVAFSRQPLPAGPGLVILTNAGGPAILATDACDRMDVALASLQSDTINRLRAVLPDAAALYNPVDVLGDAPASRYEDALGILVDDPNVHAVLVVLTPQATTQARETADAVARIARQSGVTTLACFMGDTAVADGVTALRQGSVPHYPFPERAIATIAAMQRYRIRLGSPPSAPIEIQSDRTLVRDAIDHAKVAGRTFITEQSASRIAEAYGVTVPRGGLAHDLSQAKRLAREIGYPIVMKIASPDILHKSDIGGIRVGIDNDAVLAIAYEEIISRARAYMADARIWGVTLQQQVPPGREVIIGVNRDPQFGPLLMFGLGGIYVEVLKDVTFRLCPVTPEEAHRMVTEIRGFGLLRGVRGQRPADLESVVDVITRVSALVTDFDEITELDINPLIVHDKGNGSVAADIRIGIGG
ncbi:MAG: acetate--CoA ligase family protein [Coriobacteriia bacterium]|nr:acetate--CoA ligase family protein [Coriobacteriia bacterium]